MSSLAHTASIVSTNQPTAPKVTREIAKDIYLEKELEPSSGGYPVYIFRLVTRCFKVVNFEADFTGSNNCEFYELHGPLDRKVFTKNVEPELEAPQNSVVREKQTLIIKVRLRENWKLKSKFKFSLTNPPKVKQRAFIREDVDILEQDLEKFVEAFTEKNGKIIPFEKMSMQNIQQRLK